MRELDPMELKFIKTGFMILSPKGKAEVVALINELLKKEYQIYVAQRAKKRQSRDLQAHPPEG
ncbi:MAG: hypothetical protein HY884_00775 [Deltaproteobacteria bacterium]|nr:hypothetical protein [Deltaproteobacteria bacterium]